MHVHSDVSRLLALASFAPSLGDFGPRVAHVSSGRYMGKATVNPVTDGVFGSCGTALADGQMFVALSNVFMRSESPSPYCGMRLSVTNTGPDGDDSISGRNNTVVVTVQLTAWSALTGGSWRSTQSWAVVVRG